MSTSGAARPSSVDEAVELFIAGRERGERLQPAEFAARHPELGNDLIRALEALIALDHAPAYAKPSLPPRIGAFRIEREIGRGAMGVVYEAVEEPLGRRIALKVLPPEQLSSPSARARFAREAELAARLDHPALATVYGAGIDVDRPWIAMRYVAGESLAHAIARSRSSGATSVQLAGSGAQARGAIESIAECLARVAAALQYAHDQGVVHRDVKPSNILVLPDGMPVLVDFGLAIAEEQADRSLTRTGESVGTPAYLAPECIGAQIAHPDALCDVYALGVTLYECLALRRPFEAPTLAALYRAIGSGPSLDVRALNRSVPRDLSVVIATAMEPDRSRRYRSAAALAADLRACVDGRPIAARPVPLHGRLLRWMRREPRLAAASAALVLTTIGGLAWVSWVQATASRSLESKNAALSAMNSRLEAANSSLATATTKAELNQRVATKRADDVLALSAIQDLQDLIQRADLLWPVEPAKVPELETWLHDARGLLTGRPADESRGIKARPGLADHQRKLAELESNATPRGSADSSASTEPAEHARPQPFAFDSSEERWWHAQLAKLIADLEAFADPSSGLASAGVNPAHGWGIERRLREARSIEARSLRDARVQALWSEAIASIRDRAQSPAYNGLEVGPQLGLVPIGQDPNSRLWEFAHIESGDLPERVADGRLVITLGMSIVLVLIPGGRFWMGCQSADPDGPNYDPEATPSEGPVHEIELQPFFLSKYEITQDQWHRFVGRNPSAYFPGKRFGGKEITALHPVEQVSWSDAQRMCERLGLMLPSEAQWEYAARAGTRTIWWTGSEKASLQGAANLADNFAKLNGGPGNWTYESWIDDGYVVHAPVGSFRPNAFGLQDMTGNVWEFCRDGFARYDRGVRPGDGERDTGSPSSRVIRGGSFAASARQSRAAARNDVTPTYSDYNLGLRPARLVVRK